MLFRKKKSVDKPNGEVLDQAPRPARACVTHSSAETAHLIGPGCVKLRAEIPVWKPVDGSDLTLHPRYLKRIICYGNVDFSTATLHLLWERSIQIAFLSPDCRKILGVLQPHGNSPNLCRMQHLAAEDPAFVLRMSQDIVHAKLEQAAENLRYFQRQAKGNGDCSASLAIVKDCLSQITRSKQVDSLLGTEGRAAAAWYAYFASLLPNEWPFAGRKA